jgi:hypothetical protein
VYAFYADLFGDYEDDGLNWEADDSIGCILVVLAMTALLGLLATISRYVALVDLSSEACLSYWCCSNCMS